MKGTLASRTWTMPMAGWPMRSRPRRKPSSRPSRSARQAARTAGHVTVRLLAAENIDQRKPGQPNPKMASMIGAERIWTVGWLSVPAGWDG